MRPSFDFCEPGEDPLTGEAKPHVGAAVSENLGQILLGERIRHSPYHVAMRDDALCVPVCKRAYDYASVADRKQFNMIAAAIRTDYMHHWCARVCVRACVCVPASVRLCVR